MSGRLETETAPTYSTVYFPNLIRTMTSLAKRVNSVYKLSTSHMLPQVIVIDGFRAEVVIEMLMLNAAMKRARIINSGLRVVCIGHPRMLPLVVICVKWIACTPK